MTAVVLALTWSCAIGITTTASRMTWSFARDRGTPFSSLISRVSTNTKIPVIAVLVVVLFAGLLTLIYVGSETAFNDVISLTITGFYGSYFLPCAFLLYHRVKGHIAPKHPAVSSEPSTPLETDIVTEHETNKEAEKVPSVPSIDIASSQQQLAWGPFRIPGWLGIINNAYACVYMLFVIFWSVWPPATPVTASTMNYSVVVTGGVIIFSVIWYWVRGRKEYTGPVIDEGVTSAVIGVGGV